MPRRGGWGVPSIHPLARCVMNLATAATGCNRSAPCKLHPPRPRSWMATAAAAWVPSACTCGADRHRQQRGRRVLPLAPAPRHRRPHRHRTGAGMTWDDIFAANRCRTRTTVPEWGRCHPWATATVPPAVDDIVKTAVLSRRSARSRPRRAGQRDYDQHAPNWARLPPSRLPGWRHCERLRIIPAQQNASRFPIRWVRPYDPATTCSRRQRYMVDWAIRQGRGALFGHWAWVRLRWSWGAQNVHKHTGPGLLITPLAVGPD